MFVLVRLVVVGRGIVRGIGGEGRRSHPRRFGAGSRDGRSQIRREEAPTRRPPSSAGRADAFERALVAPRIVRDACQGRPGGAVVASSRGVSSSPPANASRIRSSIERDVARARAGRWRARHRAPRRRTSPGRRRGRAAATARRDVLDERRAATPRRRATRARAGRARTVAETRRTRDKRVARARRAPAAAERFPRGAYARSSPLSSRRPSRKEGEPSGGEERARGGCARPTGEPKGHFANYFLRRAKSAREQRGVALAPRRARQRFRAARPVNRVKRPPPPRARRLLTPSPCRRSTP